MGWGHLLGLVLITSVEIVAAPTAPSILTHSTVPTPYKGTFEIIPQISCVTADGFGRAGSGVRISDDLVITAHHVVEDVKGIRKCTINGQPAKLIYVERNVDFAVLQVHLGVGYRATYSCDGFKPGQRYLAIGHTSDNAVFEPLISTNQKVDDDGQQLLNGKIYPGMSGGATIELDTGVLVGINVAAHKEGKPWAWSVPLTSTYLCRKN